MTENINIWYGICFDVTAQCALTTYEIQTDGLEQPKTQFFSFETLVLEPGKDLTLRRSNGIPPSERDPYPGARLEVVRVTNVDGIAKEEVLDSRDHEVE